MAKHSFAKHLNEVREAAGISQFELARRTSPAATAWRDSAKPDFAADLCERTWLCPQEREKKQFTAHFAEVADMPR